MFVIFATSALALASAWKLPDVGNGNFPGVENIGNIPEVVDINALSMAISARDTTCQPGAGPLDQADVRRDVQKQEDCEKICKEAALCMSFDYKPDWEDSEESREKNDACRLYATHKGARIGEEGSDGRQFCTVDGPCASDNYDAVRGLIDSATDCAEEGKTCLDPQRLAKFSPLCQVALLQTMEGFISGEGVSLVDAGLQVNRKCRKKHLQRVYDAWQTCGTETLWDKLCLWKKLRFRLLKRNRVPWRCIWAIVDFYELFEEAANDDENFVLNQVVEQESVAFSVLEEVVYEGSDDFEDEDDDVYVDVALDDLGNGALSVAPALAAFGTIAAALFLA